MQKVTIFASVALVGALSLGVATPAFAHGGGRDGGSGAAVSGDTQLTDLATRLGITKEKIVQAERDQAKADIDKAVAAGTITAAQGAAYKQIIDANLSTSGHGVRLPHLRTSATATTTAAQRQAAADARLAEFLGRLGVTKEAYQKALADQSKAGVDAAVTAGRLNGAQAAARKALIDANVAAGDLGGGRGGFDDGGGGRGGRH